jgi:hypothetical protein
VHHHPKANSLRGTAASRAKWLENAAPIKKMTFLVWTKAPFF